MFPPITTSFAYRLAGLGGMVVGQSILPSFQVGHPAMELKESKGYLSHSYQPSPGVYTARQLVAVVSPLLETVVLKLGRDQPNEQPARDILIDGLAACLATAGRESTLPLSYSATDTSRKEIARQAHRIGKSLIEHARELFNAENGNPKLVLRSPCEGHLWTSEVASLLLGPRSQGPLMELYNEWLHRMILIRDALLPFENYNEVPLVIPETSLRGLRDFEEPRKVFLLQCITSTISQSAIVDVAKVFTGPNLPRGGYGLQYSQGLILPAFLSGSSCLHLLRHHPARLDDSQTNFLFDYEHRDYYSAPRKELEEVSEPECIVPPGVWPPPSLLALNPQITKSSLGVDIGSDSSRRILKLQLNIDAGICVSVDLGQIARGRRYAYRALSRSAATSDSSAEFQADGQEGLADMQNASSTLAKELSLQSPSPSPPMKSHSKFGKGLSSALLHKATTVLTQPGLVTSSKKNIHIIPAKDPVIGLALLGKLYPDNVILLRENEAPESAEKTGKGFGARFVILGGSR